MIICNIDFFDPALLQCLQCIKRNDGQFVSIDGQHTGSVIAGLIDEGFIKGDWKTFEFPVQFIETDDLAFARRAFQTLNGKGKKKQSAYNKFFKKMNAQIKAENPTMKQALIMKLVSEQWNAQK